jgi:hypothetical protein
MAFNTDHFLINGRKIARPLTMIVVRRSNSPIASLAMTTV